MKKLRVAVLFGGRSGEHDVSLMSARSMLAALDPEKYEVTQVGITLDGEWLNGENTLESFSQRNIEDLNRVVLPGEPSHSALYVLRSMNGHEILEKLADIDVFFPVLHGPFGEDGTLQGLLELADVAYVGAGVAGSSVGMDKGIFKDVMRANGIPIVDSILVLRGDIENDINAVIAQVEKMGAYPFFAKPANLGSSVGISKCDSRSDLGEGLMEAARYDRRIIVERGVGQVREIEVSVLGNEDPQTSVCGEVMPSREFYSYESKYVDGTSGLVIPAQLPAEVSDQVRAYAVRAYKAIDCAGMARADFFLENDTNKIYLNELNTIPGFTSISMYPKLWQASGLTYAQLVDRLIELALERKAQRDHTEHRRQA
ncbi:D-alanine--D-alanine ligase family protein [Candidatus Villigracilis saccharophilus]|uniref:D-alanine--D-alanine ligase family protein n=1 Tax=Candidatus Villigracilis saccharophilus TaxID=3140684 RepID=UPI003137084E|nr:D-alanine--D-alanine ligase [Anaerolineales bacterium]